MRRMRTMTCKKVKRRRRRRMVQVKLVARNGLIIINCLLSSTRIKQ